MKTKIVKWLLAFVGFVIAICGVAMVDSVGVVPALLVVAVGAGIEMVTL